MPSYPSQICRYAGCGELTNKSYCEQHVKEKKKGSGWLAYHGGKSRHERGYGHKWDLLRIKILRRDCYMCIPCKNNGLMTAAKAVDHRVPKAQGGTDDPDNLQSICNDCHKNKTSKESSGKIT